MASFVDTNILVYAEDRHTKAQHETARDLVIELWEKREGVLSIQVLQEFYVTATRKLKKPLSAAKAQEIVHEYLTWTVVEKAGRLLSAALELHQSAQLSFWDAMVVQAAIEAGALFGGPQRRPTFRFCRRGQSIQAAVISGRA